jgi:demethoxyubiquinone hydroxylase (CLK1/Coq7/Cat5 family)
MGALRPTEAPLIAELHRALLAEIGARSIYGWLARFVRDRELRQVLARFQEEEVTQIDRLSRVLTALGERPTRRGLRRRFLAAALACTVPVIGSRPALRICEEAEGTAARWYAHFRELLDGRGRRELAQACNELATTKLRHALALQAWVRNAPRR